MSDANPIPYLFDLLSVTRLVTNFNVMASTMYIWDYILAFSMEVDLIWKSKWSFMKGLYLFQRYLPFLEITGILYYATGVGLTKTFCRNFSFGGAVISGLRIIASEMIPTLRTWAVWNRNRHLSIILPILFILVEGSSLVIMGIYFNSVKYNDPPYPGFKGCFPTNAHKYDLVFMSALAIIWDSLMLTLMLIPGIRAFRSGGNSDLVNTVYRDGVIYYLYLFVLSFINIIVLATLPNQQFLLIAVSPLNTHKSCSSRYSRSDGR
ncbi:hypothetical protein M413DRAFT_292129 [Hebeloma cylindrosporum]|uniref:DUF6533 domain-containing protein n=1 Tax=Hebeloma cylindrosporum TaxID=76867 RepID=A0A0C3BI07_HEBCY|nr:hypothetical protein M413DRAFT_292129 [Hebeloma cylindrosporum h7]